MKQRVDRLNSLLKEVISEVIKKDVKNPHVSELVTVMQVSITKDLRHAKVYISVIGNELTKKDTLLGLEASAGFIGHTASKKVVMRYFPSLHFILDDGISSQMRVEELLQQISKEKANRETDADAQEDDEDLDGDTDLDEDTGIDEDEEKS